MMGPFIHKIQDPDPSLLVRLSVLASPASCAFAYSLNKEEMQGEEGRSEREGR